MRANPSGRRQRLQGEGEVRLLAGRHADPLAGDGPVALGLDPDLPPALGDVPGEGPRASAASGFCCPYGDASHGSGSASGVGLHQCVTLAPGTGSPVPASRTPPEGSLRAADPGFRLSYHSRSRMPLSPARPVACGTSGMPPIRRPSPGLERATECRNRRDVGTRPSYALSHLASRLPSGEARRGDGAAGERAGRASPDARHRSAPGRAVQGPRLTTRPSPRRSRP